ncbi:MAG: Asp-tRNA(Asn)/Glu-tRNA(Gln) amidotransferase subunit GatC [Anaerolineae bacterium]|nr:MAG: Asp-tRNA(Asn)/Glu-tRNA(Gln) amidotransferase subunit GatC [Anaerolineae bacterium]
MSLTREDVQHIAHLARLTLTEEELERYREQLSSILEHVARLQELDTTDVPPYSGALAAAMPLRPDEPGKTLPTQTLLRAAPDTAADQFRVPPILDEGRDE